MKFLSYFLILISYILVAGCGDKQAEVDSHDHPELSSGKNLFDHHCASCHGEKGAGKFIDGIPPNALTQKTPAMVMKKIRFGDNDKSVMPVFANMSEDEAELIVGHLFKLKQLMLSEQKM